MTVKGETPFIRSSGSVLPATLTNVTGIVYPLVTGTTGMYKVECLNETVTDFFLDWNGTEFQQVIDIGTFASDEVPITTQYFWLIDGKTVEKMSYISTVSAINADDQIPTAYSAGEYVPDGVIHFVRVTSGASDSGAYSIYCYAMCGRQ